MEGCHYSRNECAKRSHSFGLFNPSEGFCIRIHRHSKGKDGNQTIQDVSKLKTETLLGNHFWSRGYFVSTIGLNEDMIKQYVKYQEHHE